MSDKIILLSQEELLKGVKVVNPVKSEKAKQNTSSASKRKSSKSQKRTAKKP